MPCHCHCTNCLPAPPPPPPPPPPPEPKKEPPKYQLPPPCWFLAHDRTPPCGCGGTKCEEHYKQMSKLVLCGFDPYCQEDVAFLRCTVVNEAGNVEKTVAAFAKWKSGHDTKWHFTN